MTSSDRLRREISTFGSSDIWAGGYFEGDPLDPMGRTGSYGQFGYMSVLHATWLACIKPYVGPETVAFEIGPGRGAWTRTLLPAREVWAVDVLPAEHNGFDGYVGHHDNVHYVQARDFTLADLPDDHFTYAFSFGTLCHITFDGIAEYAQASHRKMRPGAHGFWMIADYAKRNAAAKNINRYSPWSRLAPTRPRFATGLLRALAWVDVPHHAISADADEEPSPGRWFDAGTERTCKMLEQVGFEVVDPDMGVNHRDPVIHFVRP